MWEVITKSGKVLKEDLKNKFVWRSIDEPIVNMTCCGIAVKKSDKYFYTVKYIAFMGGQAQPVAYIFGGVTGDMVLQYTLNLRHSSLIKQPVKSTEYTSSSLKMDTYPLKDFKFNAELREGV